MCHNEAKREAGVSKAMLLVIIFFYPSRVIRRPKDDHRLFPTWLHTAAMCMHSSFSRVLGDCSAEPVHCRAIPISISRGITAIRVLALIGLNKVASLQRVAMGSLISLSCIYGWVLSLS